MAEKFSSAKSLYHHWLKTYGGDAIWHEAEIVRDINAFAGERVREANEVTLKFMEKKK